jgi:hypothetical protein
MRPMMRWIVALALPALLLTGSLVEAQKKSDPDKDVEKSAEKMVSAGKVSGKVMAIYEDKKKIRVQVSFQVPNPAGMPAFYQAQMQMAKAKNPQEAYNARVALAQAQQGLYKTETKDIEFQATDDVVVRMARPKEEFDDKGKPKRYTKKEKLELKGDNKKLPGYKAEFGDITTDQYIQLSLVRKKGSIVAKAPRRVKGKDRDAAAEADLAAENAPQASLILIVREPPPAGK